MVKKLNKFGQFQYFDGEQIFKILINFAKFARQFNEILLKIWEHSRKILKYNWKELWKFIEHLGKSARNKNILLLTNLRRIAVENFINLVGRIFWKFYL